MSRDPSEGALASTMIDVFDSKQRMRQGTFNLYLWQNRELDMSLECTTPGLFKVWPKSQAADSGSALQEKDNSI